MKNLGLCALLLACGLILPACGSIKGTVSQSPDRAVTSSSSSLSPVEDVIQTMYLACKSGNYEQVLDYFPAAGRDDKQFRSSALMAVCGIGTEGGSSSYEIVRKTETEDGRVKVYIVHTESSGKKRSPIYLTFEYGKSTWGVFGFCSDYCQ
jgi:hypothetical protein